MKENQTYIMWEYAIDKKEKKNTMLQLKVIKPNERVQLKREKRTPIDQKKGNKGKEEAQGKNV